MVDFVKDFIQLRQSIKAFRLKTRQEINNHVSITHHQHAMIEYTIQRQIVWFL